MIFVGECNPHSSECALCLCHPDSSGERLRRILGLRPETYLALDRRNLCGGKWDMKVARREAFRMEAEGRPALVLLGRRVATAFGCGTDTPLMTNLVHGEGIAGVLLAHPSGKSRVWNYPASRLRARELLREYSTDVPWGETEE